MPQTNFKHTLSTNGFAARLSKNLDPINHQPKPRAAKKRPSTAFGPRPIDHSNKISIMPQIRRPGTPFLDPRPLSETPNNSTSWESLKQFRPPQANKTLSPLNKTGTPDGSETARPEPNKKSQNGKLQLRPITLSEDLKKIIKTLQEKHTDTDTKKSLMNPEHLDPKISRAYIENVRRKAKKDHQAKTTSRHSRPPAPSPNKSLPALEKLNLNSSRKVEEIELKRAAVSAQRRIARLNRLR